jgi:class 3 adenylate cyclase/tetratricopeptide (TPR) repeat protein
VNCPHCQAENKDGARFCSECGVPLALRCPSCGADHRAGQRFCDECGFALALSPPATGPAVRAEASPGATAEMRLVSVLFVDLVGFTSLSEGRDAEDVRELLGRYFDSARTIIERYGGTIEKFIGDAVMAVWGVPVAREDDAERAVRAALDIVDAVGVFGAEVGAPELRARAGVVTGQVAALENPHEGLVVGDRVNTASRVQSAAQPGSVYVDEVTRNVTSAAILYEDAGEHTVKGKADPLRLWRAGRVVAGVGGSDRAQGIEAPFVGRDADLRLLKGLFHGALERRTARLVAISGEAGVGKSRLLREFANYTDGITDRFLWHNGRCLSYGEGVAYWALAEMVRQRFGIPEDASPGDTSEKLAAGLVRWVPDPADRDFLHPRLGALLGVAEPGLGREDLFAGWRLLFEHLSLQDPVVLVFEDMQWADDGLLDFIGELLDWSSQVSIFILTLARPELAGTHHGWPAGIRGATLVALEPLDDAAMIALLDGVVEALPRAAARRIVAQAQGVPLYAVETVRALVDRGVLAEEDGRLVLIDELGELDVPASLGSLLAARIDALEPAERQLVKAMSVFGGSFPRTTAAALGEVSEDLVDTVLSGLVRKQVLAIRADRLSPDRGQYTFAQGLLRTVAYEMLSRQERKTRHLAAAEHLRDVFPGGSDEVAEAVATHLLDAHRAAHGDPDADAIRAMAVDALRQAAGRGVTVGAPETAERAYLTARELVEGEADRIELTELAGEMALRSGHYDRALSDFEEATEGHAAAGRERESARACARAALALNRLGRHEEAITRTREALAALGPDVATAEAGELIAQLGAARGRVGDNEGAIETLERALQIGSDLQLIPLFVDALNIRQIAFQYLGRVIEARALLTETIQLARRHDLTHEVSRAQNNLGNLCLQWDLPDSETHLQAALSEARRRGDRFLESMAALNLGTLLLFMGRWGEADALNDELLEDQHDQPGRDLLFQNIVLLAAFKGDNARALEDLDRLESWGTSDDLDLRASYQALQAVQSLYAGDPASALEHGRAMLPPAIAAVGAASDPVRMAYADTVQAAARAGRVDVLGELITLLAEAPPGRIPPYLRAELARARGLLAAAEDRHDDAERELMRAVDELCTLGYPYHLALAQTDLARWLIERGREAEAEVPLEQACAVLRGLDATPALARAETLRLSPTPAGPSDPS